MRLAGKVAIVTGAGSIGPGWGNGKATAVEFAREGARVLVADINRDAAEETRALIEADGNEAHAVVADVSRAAEVEAMVAACVKRFGGVDVLHNNVGIYRLGGPVDLPEEVWEHVIATNLRSLFLTCKHVLPLMLAAGGGAIVNVGSISGMRYMGLPQIAYATSKGAIAAFTRGVAAEYGRCGVRCNVVVPGIVDTPVLAMAAAQAYAAAYGNVDAAALRRAREETVPLGRFGTAWDVARASAYLASDDAAYVSGTELLVDGGLAAVVPQPPRPSP